MTTNLSIERLAGSLVRENLEQSGFTVTLQPANDLERLALQLELMGCAVSRNPELGTLTANLGGAPCA